MSIEAANQHPASEKFKDPEINEAFEEFDFETLRSIFEKYATKSGVEPSEIGFVEPEDITRGGSLKSLMLLGGSYSPGEKNIEIVESSIKLVSGIGHDKKAILFSVLIHEQVHALGHNQVAQHEEEMLFSIIKRQITTNKTGSFEASSNKVLGKSILLDSKLRWFNEGMVDELASEVYEEYTQQKQPEPFDTEKTMEFISSYPFARLFIRTLRDRISQESGIPEETVWRALVRLYIEGDSIIGDEVKESLNEVFSEKFFDRLAKIDTATSNPVNLTLVFKEVLTKEITKKIITSIKEQLKDQMEKI